MYRLILLLTVLCVGCEAASPAAVNGGPDQDQSLQSIREQLETISARLDGLEYGMQSVDRFKEKISEHDDDILGNKEYDIELLDLISTLSKLTEKNDWWALQAFGTTWDVLEEHGIKVRPRLESPESIERLYPKRR